VKNIKLILSLIVTFSLLGYLFHKTPFDEVLKSTKNVNLELILVAVVISIMSNIFLTAYRWRAILKKLKCPISWKESILVKMGSDSLISILPMKTGEAFRVLYLTRTKKVSHGKAILSIISEYCLNFVFLLLSIFIGLFFYLVRNNLTLSGNIGFASGLFLLSNERFRAAKDNWKSFVNNRMVVPFKKIKSIFFDRNILMLTFLLAILELLNVYLISKALGIHIPLYAIFVYVPMIILISSIPITILGLGLRESVVLLFFLKYASSDSLLSLGILYSFIEHVIPMLIGLSLTGLFLNRIFFTRK